MDLYTLSGAADVLGCNPNRLKDWMNKGYLPEKRIQLGKLKARVVEAELIAVLEKVLYAVDNQGMSPAAAFNLHSTKIDVN